jgi:hypothetical protein
MVVLPPIKTALFALIAWRKSAPAFGLPQAAEGLPGPVRILQ